MFRRLVVAGFLVVAASVAAAGPIAEKAIEAERLLDAGRPLEAAQALDAAVEAAWQEMPLTVRNIQQVTEATGYGVYVPRESHVYKPGEKLFEELRHHTEQHLPTGHPRIMRFVNESNAAAASRMAINELEPFVDDMPVADLKRGLKVVIPEYEPSFD